MTPRLHRNPNNNKHNPQNSIPSLPDSIQTLTTTNIIPKSGVEESIFLHCHIEQPTGYPHCHVERPMGFLHCHIERPTGYPHCHVERPTGVETSLYKSFLKISSFASLSRYDSVRHISHYHPQKPPISRMTPSFYRHHPQKPLISRMTPSFYRHHPQKPPFPRMTPSFCSHHPQKPPFPRMSPSRCDECRPPDRPFSMMTFIHGRIGQGFAKGEENC